MEQQPSSATGEQTLNTGLAALGLTLSPDQTQQLLDYLGLLQKWAAVYNLTAVRNPADMLTHHLLDSLAVMRPLQAHRPQRLLDVGSGAGLPGVVIAICCPDIDVTCVDAVAKKTAFIAQAALALKLPNLHSLHTRVEKLTDPSYDLIISRAFATLADFVNGSTSALAPGGCWLAMKGKHPTDELAALPSSITAFHVEQLQVPGLDAQRCLVWMRKLLK